MYLKTVLKLKECSLLRGCDWRPSLHFQKSPLGHCHVYPLFPPVCAREMAHFGGDLTRSWAQFADPAALNPGAAREVFTWGLSLQKTSQSRSQRAGVKMILLPVLHLARSMYLTPLSYKGSGLVLLHNLLIFLLCHVRDESRTIGYISPTVNCKLHFSNPRQIGGPSQP